jgi:Fur family peroxide stress response transcriptional regulator
VSHPGAQWIYEQLKPEIPDLSLATVYRNLNLFRIEGAALSLGVINGEERFDGFTGPHPHLACERCGAVRDILLSDAAAFEQNLAAALGSCVNGGSIEGPRRIPYQNYHVLLPAAGLVDFRRTLFYGLCTSCVSSDVP